MLRIFVGLAIIAWIFPLYSSFIAMLFTSCSLLYSFDAIVILVFIYIDRLINTRI